MTIEIEAPDGSVVEFPDGTADAVIERAMRETFPSNVKTGGSTIVPASSMPPATRASQSDVRASEPYAIPEGRGDTAPMAAQRERQRQFDAARLRWIQATGGVIPPGKNVNQAVAEWSGLPDPASTVDRAEQEHLAEGGDIGDTYGDSVPYAVSKVGAAMLGARGGPMGSAVAEMIPRLSAVVFAVNKGVQSGALNADDAAAIVLKELSKGFATDAAFNIGVPALSKLIGSYALKLPGAKWLADRAEQIATKAVQRATAGLPVSAPPAAVPAVGKEPMEEWLKNKPTDTPRELKAKARARLVPDNPKRQEAIRDLSDRLPDDKMMTPGSVTDEPGAWESNVRKSRPIEMARMDKAMEGSADDMLRAGTNPESQMAREDLGNTILSTANKTQEAVKQRLRPVFERADNLDVQVDFSDVERSARDALKAAERVPGSSPQQVKELEALKKLVQWFDDRAERFTPHSLNEMKAERDRLMKSRDLAQQEWGKFQTFKEQQQNLADNFTPVPGMPRVPGRLSEHPERVAEGAAAAAEAKGLAAKRLGDSRALEPQIAALDAKIGALEGRPFLRAEDALDFVSDQKAVLRTQADWQPSTRFETLINRLVTKADEAYTKAAAKTGDGQLVRDLDKARRDYRTTMETVYEDAIKNALKKNPEDVGKYLWGAGNVGEIRQLHRLLGLAQKEGVTSRSGAEKVRLDVARGWLQEAVPNLDAAANWSQMLKENPAKRDTWNILSAGPNGIALNDTMKVIEQAAQMAVKKNIMPAGEMAVISRASKGSLGQSFYSGDVKAPLYIAGLNLSRVVKAAATAYTHGDRGTLNGIMQVLRAQSAGTPAAAKGAQAAYEKLRAFAKENDLGDLEEQEQK